MTTDPAAKIVKPLPEHLMVRHDGAAETRWDSMPAQGDTPADRFFVRNHTSTPLIDAATWTLDVFGSGLRDRPGRRDAVRFGYDELRSMPQVTHRLLLECTGNGRRLFATQQGETTPGTPWGLGAVGVATWTGVPLGAVLERAGLTSSARSVLAVGLDPEYVDDGVNHGRVRRPLPVAKALDDVLVALDMNGEPLPPDHGFPARLVVPGWVGVASIKWLGEIEVADHELSSPWSTTYYNVDDEALTELVPKSVLELAPDAELAAGQQHRLTVRAWSGSAPVTSVEVSTDDGRSWSPADKVEDGPWSRWSYDWRPQEPGRYTVLTRATDATGNIQPSRAPSNPRGYLFGAVVRHPVQVV
ncbi:sulfite oxidase [Georgenia alba]|uniref:Sulfite oxidase n=1 Tax=Georgenia alba TaxID=2233858 RepID=A0ABW2QAG8_9MICO